MEIVWRAGQNKRGLGVFGLTHLLLLDRDELRGPFCANMWSYTMWTRDPDPKKCPWCIEAARWIRLVEGEPLDVLKRIPGYHPAFRKGTLTTTDSRAKPHGRPRV